MQTERSIAESFFELLPRLHHLLRQGGAGPRQDALLPTGPDVPGQIRTMNVIRRRGPTTMHDLASAIEVSAPTMSGIVKRLAAHGMVSRTPDSTDGRVVIVDLTPRGAAAMDEFRRSRIEALQSHIDRLDPDDREAIQHALPALRNLLDLTQPADRTTTRCS